MVRNKVTGDENHNDAAPVCIPVTISEAQSDEPAAAPDSGAAVTPASDGTQTPAVQKADPITIPKTPASVKARAKKNKVTVSWKKIKKTKKTKKLLKLIKRIEIQYSTDPKFTQNVLSKKVGKSKTKVTLKLQKKKTYYFRVRYVGAAGVSKWSKVRKVKTK